MLSPSHFVLGLLSLAIALVSGCSTSSSNETASRGGKGAAAVVGRPDTDYSPAAVKARVESQAHFSAAVLHEQDDEPELAALEYFQAGMADPANEELVLEASGRLLRFKGVNAEDPKPAEMRDKALALLRKATARPQASGSLFARLGLVYSLLGNRDLAIQANRNAIRRAPESLAGYQYLAQLYLQNNQLQEGIKVLDEAARQPRSDAAFLIDLGETYVAFARGGATEQGRAKALQCFQRAATLKPSNAALLQRLAAGFATLGDLDRAVGVYGDILQRLPNLTVVREKLVELYLRKQDRTNAAVQLRAIIRESPANPQTHYLLGSLLLENHQLNEAAESFAKTILLSPNFEPAYYDLAAAQLNGTAAKEALTTLEQARSRFQTSFVGEFYTALAYSRLKDYTNSLRYLTSAEIIARATATNRLTHTFYFQIGSAYERTQRPREAEKYFRKALELSPDYAEALNYLGYMWTERGENLEEARILIERALKQEPKNAAYLDSLGWVLFRLNRPKEALKYLLQAIEQSEEPDATLYEHLGDVYTALLEPAKARAAWQRSIAIEPNDAVQKKLGPDAADSPAPPSGKIPK